MIYKDDWEKTKERMKTWWSGEIIDRPIVQVTVPRKDVKIESSWNGWYLVHNLDNPEKIIEEFENYCKKTCFVGESFPNLWINMGPGILAAYLGSPVSIKKSTVWFEVENSMDWNDILSHKLNPDEKWWKITKELTTKITEYGKNKFFTGITDLNAVLTTLGSLRKTEKLLTDLMDSPQKVKEACEYITKIWFSCYDELLKITQKHNEGSSSWMGIWFPGRGSDVQCDFSAMISPKMFEEFVLPHLQEQCRKLDYTIYHWDGPGQIPHLELLLNIPELNGIQWIPGEGNPNVGSQKWFPLYKRIQEKGKLLVLQGMQKDDIERVMNEISPEGLLISTSCDSEQEAKDLLHKVEQWTKKK